MSQSYRTIKIKGESLHKVKGSKHFGYAMHVRDEEEVAAQLESLRKEHHGARHHCYAWRLGRGGERERANDDGEPGNSAGKPILGQIHRYDLTDTLVVVVRYFGGTKLGVGGLIDAYRTAAQEAIANAQILERNILAHYKLSMPYGCMGEVEKLLRMAGWEIDDISMQEVCTMRLAIEQEKDEQLREMMSRFDDLRIDFIGMH